MNPEHLEEHLTALGNHSCTKRALLRGAAFGAGGLAAGELAKVFPDATSIVRAEGPTLLSDFNRLKPEDRPGFLEQHLNLANDAGIESFGKISLASITDIEKHVVARHQTASRPEYQASHCPDTASYFLRTILSQDRLPEGMKVFVQQEILKGGQVGKEILRLVYPFTGVNSNGAPVQGIVAYLSETGKGTVYTVPDINRLGTKGREITNDAQAVREKIARVKANFRDECDKRPPTPQPITVPVSAPANATESENTGISPVVLVVLAALGLVALRTRGQNQGRTPA